ncbi:MAG: hypothetical protein ACRDT8_22965 [Micromonosporaceae bacterium]
MTVREEHKTGSLAARVSRQAWEKALSGFARRSVATIRSGFDVAVTVTMQAI